MVQAHAATVVVRQGLPGRRGRASGGGRDRSGSRGDRDRRRRRIHRRRGEAGLAGQHARPLRHDERLELLVGGPRRRHALGHGLRVHGLHGEGIVGEAIVLLDGRVMLRMRIVGAAVDPLAGGVVVALVWLMVVVVLLVLHAHMAHCDLCGRGRSNRAL